MVVLYEDLMSLLRNDQTMYGDEKDLGLEKSIIGNNSEVIGTLFNLGNEFYDIYFTKSQYENESLKIEPQWILGKKIYSPALYKENPLFKNVGEKILSELDLVFFDCTGGYKIKVDYSVPNPLLSSNCRLNKIVDNKELRNSVDNLMLASRKLDRIEKNFEEILYKMSQRD